MVFIPPEANFESCDCYSENPRQTVLEVKNNIYLMYVKRFYFQVFEMSNSVNGEACMSLL